MACHRPFSLTSVDLSEWGGCRLGFNIESGEMEVFVPVDSEFTTFSATKKDCVLRDVLAHLQDFGDYVSIYDVFQCSGLGTDRVYEAMRYIAKKGWNKLPEFEEVHNLFQACSRAPENSILTEAEKVVATAIYDLLSDWSS
jgi:neutral trehalase